MRGIGKGFNIVLIFTLIGVFLCQNLAYASDISHLRVPVAGHKRIHDAFVSGSQLIEKTRNLLKENFHISLEKAAMELGYKGKAPQSTLSSALIKADMSWTEIKKDVLIKKTRNLLKENFHIRQEDAAIELGYETGPALSKALTRAHKPWTEIKRERLLRARVIELIKALAGGNPTYSSNL